MRRAALEARRLQQEARARSDAEEAERMRRQVTRLAEEAKRQEAERQEFERIRRQLERRAEAAERNCEAYKSGHDAFVDAGKEMFGMLMSQNKSTYDEHENKRAQDADDGRAQDMRWEAERSQRTAALQAQQALSQRQASELAQQQQQACELSQQHAAAGAGMNPVAAAAATPQDQAAGLQSVDVVACGGCKGTRKVPGMIAGLRWCPVCKGRGYSDGPQQAPVEQRNDPAPATPDPQNYDEPDPEATAPPPPPSGSLSPIVHVAAAASAARKKSDNTAATASAAKRASQKKSSVSGLRKSSEPLAKDGHTLLSAMAQESVFSDSEGDEAFNEELEVNTNNSPDLWSGFRKRRVVLDAASRTLTLYKHTEENKKRLARVKLVIGHSNILKCHVNEDRTALKIATSIGTAWCWKFTFREVQDDGCRAAGEGDVLETFIGALGAHGFCDVENMDLRAGHESGL